MSFNQGIPGPATLINSSSTLLYGNTSSGNALSVQQLGAGNVASFRTTTGATALFVNAAGNVGVGTGNPAYALDVFTGTMNAATVTLTSTPAATGNVLTVTGSSTNGNVIQFSNTAGGSFVFTSGGRVGINKTNPTVSLDVTGSLAVSGTISQGGTPLAASQWTTLNTNIYYLSNVTIGATTVDPKYTLIVSGNVAVTKDVFVFYSDERLKTKLGTLENALDKVCSLEGFTYVPNDLARSIGATDDDRVRVGLSAQSVQRVLPEAVGPAPFNDQYLTVQYEKLVPLLVEAIKELKKSLPS